MTKLIWCLAATAFLAGCASLGLGPRTIEGVTGRVLDADTRQPLAGVAVVRGRDEQDSEFPPKAAERLMQKPPVQTGQDGHFALSGERTLVLLPFTGRVADTLAFRHNGYETLRTNYLAGTVTNFTAGKSEVDIGDVMLSPTPKRRSSYK